MPRALARVLRDLWRGGHRAEGWGFVLGRPGNDLLSRVLRHSTIGAVEFNGRVRDGIGFGLHARVTGPAKDKGNSKRVFLWLWIAMMQRHPGRRPASATARPR